MTEIEAAAKAYGSKTVGFRFKGIDLTLSLSHGLFSSYDVDSGTRLLLRVLSHYIDEAKSQNQGLPSSILDAGSGTGVIGVALGTYFQSLGYRDFTIRAQDRDELGRLFSAFNGEINGLKEPQLIAHTEPLLYNQGPYDWIISNLPAKAGTAVLKYFVKRSLTLLKNRGRVFVVIVEPLAEQFAHWLTEYGADLVETFSGPEHRIFVYGSQGSEVVASFSWEPYIRHRETYKLAEIGYTLQSLHGVADFDSPHYITQLMAALAVKLKIPIGEVLSQHREAPVLFFETDQGHFPVWFKAFLTQAAPKSAYSIKPIIAGRNILSLQATQHNMETKPDPLLVPSVDPDLSASRLLASSGSPYPLLFLFPDAIPKTDRWPAYWAALGKLSIPGSLCFIGLSATEADRFDRLKVRGFQRLGDIKRQGYRVLAYKKL